MLPWVEKPWPSGEGEVTRLKELAQLKVALMVGCPF